MIVVRFGHWTNQHEIKMQCTGGLKFVGIVHNDEGSAQFKALMRDLKAQTLYLRKTKASIDCTLLTVNCSINNALLYRGTLATWTPAQYLELDLILGRLYRAIYKLQPGTSHHLLYMPTDQCGLNCVSLKRKLFCSKWAAIHRNVQELPTISNLLRRPEEH